MTRVLSGIQPSGEIHIGNYLGAIKQWVELGERLGREAFFCIVDYHALTNPLAYDPATLARRTFEAALVNMAAGLNPEKVTLFVQSHVPEHTELSWVFTTLTPLGDLTRMTQFKDKAAKQEAVWSGLLMYPVLQAADILIYKADTVPVGEDQVQHIELTREIARRFNALFGETFPEPKALLNPEAPRVPGIDGKAKMSKSLGNTIGLLEDERSIWEKIRHLPDDPQRIRLADPGDPERTIVFTYLSYFAPKELVAALKEEYRKAGIGTLVVKRILFEELMKTLRPIRERAEELKKDPDYVMDALLEGAKRARAVAAATMEEVREKVGLLLPHEAPGIPVIRLEFPGFAGTPVELREALRRGRLSPKGLPVLLVVEQALAQVPEDLRARAELLPLLAELLVLKLSPERALTPKEEGEEAPIVRVLVDLSETVAFLEERLKRRARLLPVAPPPVPRPALRLSPKVLKEAARPFRKAVLALPREGFGLKEAWERLKGFLRGRVAFHRLPLRGWGERAVGFAALLEAHRLGLVRLHQEEPFGPLWVEAEGVLEERLA